MIKRIDDLNFYELLEIGPEASSPEIHKAYERIRRIYDPNSMALYSLFTPEETAKIRQRIEDAYRTLIYEENRRRYDAMLRQRNELPDLKPPVQRFQPRVQMPSFPVPEEEPFGPAEAAQQPAPPVRQPQGEVAPAVTPGPSASSITEFTGSVIKVLREQAGLTIRNIASMTKVGERYLAYIEQEDFKKLPARPYLRGFLVLYAKALGCDPERLTNDYLKRYDAAAKPR